MGCCSPEKRKIRAQRAGMCAVCPKRWEREGVIQCTLDGKPCVEHVKRGKCPAGRYPDKEGRVRWLGVLWVGMPKPLRWRFRWLYGRSPRVDACGCVWVLARAWERLRGVPRGTR